jgi:hypothetical protein
VKRYPALVAAVVLTTGAVVAAGLLDHPDWWRVGALVAGGGVHSGGDQRERGRIASFTMTTS